ncbi:MAG: PAS domain S-box protein [Spirochaetota bacterium]
MISHETVDGRIYETRKFPVALGGGRGVGGFVRDITDAKRDDDALRQSELKYRRLFELESDAIFLVDNETGRLIEANEAACRLYEYSREEFASMHNYDLSAEPDETRQAVSEGLSVIPVRYHRKKNGVVFPVEITATHYEWQGRPVHIAAIRDIGFRLEAERLLRESEEKYRQIFNHAPAGIYEVDVASTRLTRVNPAICEYTGYTEEELLSMNALDILTEESRGHFLDRLGKIYRGESVPPDPEFSIRKKDGSTIWVQLNAEYTWQDGRITSATVVAHDISERRKVDEALRESERKYRQLFTHAPAGIYEVDFTTGKFLRVNSLICEYTGYTEEELLSMSSLDILTEESQRHFLERLEKMGRGESLPPDPEYCIKNRNGSTRWVQINNEFKYTDGRITGATVVAHDISERKRAEDALRESEERYALIANNVADTITIMDLDLNVVYASPSIERLRGFTVDEVIAQKIDQVLTPESLEIAAAVLREELERENDPVVDRGRTRSLELEEYHRDGSTIWVGNSISFIRDEEGRPLRILIVSRDITERKRAEKALEEALVENRTLLHELRHRVKNSVAMIASMVGLEAGRAVGREAKEVLDDMRNRILSLSHMYDMIHAANESNTVRLDSYIHRIVRSLSDTLAYDRDRISISAECGPATVDAQRAALFGLIVNELVTNSVKHAFPGGGSGTVRIELAGVDGGIRLTVSDNGIGLGESFEIGKSEGLGMKLVRLLARQMKADLAVDGVGGASFSVFVAQA